MKYQVFENETPCGEIAVKIKLDISWHKDTFDDPQMAEFYASAWACGRTTGPRDAMWHVLKTLPFRMEVGITQLIKQSFMTIKEVEHA